VLRPVVIDGLVVALTNVLKHARARTVAVTVETDRHQVRLVVDDDGLGGAAATTHPGHGRLGMRERVHALGGHMADGPREVGYQVHVVIPLAPASGCAS